MELNPWQIFTILFAISSLLVKYFNHLLMTIIISVTFGGICEVVSKYLFIWNGKPKTDSLIGSQKRVVSDHYDDDTDEELEEKYANIEVNFDESETEEEEYICMNPSITKEDFQLSEELENHNFHNNNSNIAKNNIDTLEHGRDYFEDSDFCEDDLLLGPNTYTGDIPVSKGKSFIQDYNPQNDDTQIGGM